MRHAIASGGMLISVDGPRGANYLMLTCVRRRAQRYNGGHEYAVAIEPIKQTYGSQQGSGVHECSSTNWQDWGQIWSVAQWWRPSWNFARIQCKWQLLHVVLHSCTFRFSSTESTSKARRRFSAAAWFPVNLEVFDLIHSWTWSRRWATRSSRYFDKWSTQIESSWVLRVLKPNQPSQSSRNVCSSPPLSACSWMSFSHNLADESEISMTTFVSKFCGSIECRVLNNESMYI